MERAGKLPKIKDEESEGKFGYVYAVSGPGMVVDIYFIFNLLSSLI